MAILQVDCLGKYYGRRKVVDGVSFEVNLGEVVGLLGPNGAGKTTSFRMTTGQIEPNEGKVIFDGNDVTALPMFKRARLGMGYLSQEQSIFRRLTVEQNVLAVLEALPKSRSLGRKLRRQERWDRCDQVLEQFGLTHIRKNNSARCSGGEKRRLEIARCLVCEPQLILLDEPFAGVDPLTKADIRVIVRNLAKTGIGILMTDHDVGEVLESTDRIYLIIAGKVKAHGTPREIRRDSIAIDEYLGEKYRDTSSAPINGSTLSAGPGVSTVVETPSPSLSIILEQEKIRRMLEELMSNEQFPTAAAELVRRGAVAVPLLLEGLERRDVEHRRRALVVLQHILGPAAVFDPFAPEAQRRLQLEALRDRLARKAG